MKLLLFSDLHCDRDAARRLVEQSGDVDVLVGAGDFGQMREGVGVCFEMLCKVKLPAVLVPGNGESVEELQEASRIWPSAHVLHGSSVEIDGVSFYGLGGGIPVTPFGSWSYDFTEQQATELLADCGPRGVIVSHSPPQGAVDLSAHGRHLGSVALRETIERVKPRLVVCGHIHDSAGRQETIGETVVINAGPAGIVWELGE